MKWSAVQDSSNRRRTTANRMVVAVTLALSFASVAHASDVPQNLGYGLDKLVESRVMQRRHPTADSAKFNGWATAEAASYAANAITDEMTGRFMVDVVLDGTVNIEDARKSLVSKYSLDIKASDASYRKTGILEGYIDVDSAAALSQAKGVRAVFLALKPKVYRAPTSPNVVDGDHLNKIGNAFDQGVVQHRVDRIDRLYNPNAELNYDGTGISIAAMSNSYARRTVAPNAAADVASFDLPGAATNPINTQPVVVVAEGPAGQDDEGRAMVQILHKMAPRARLAFATGAFGEVAFAQSIRQLANLPGTTPVDGFRADVITDDIGYGGEPFYAESLIGNAIDDASAAGVAYFSSAGNDIGINAYESDLRIVPNGTGLTAATNSALAGTNIDLTGVPAGYYAGGFHNFNPAQGQLDVAQLVNMPAGGNGTELQWNDPYDLRPLSLNQPPIYSTTGTISNATPVISYGPTSTPPVPTLNFGQAYVIQETATSGDFDGVIKIYDSNDTLLVTQDTGTDETVQFYPPTTGSYRIEVNRFEDTAGDFTLTINTGFGTQGVTTDLNLLVFDATTGAYIASSSLTSNNIANNRPVELGDTIPPGSATQVQFVIARGNVPPAGSIRPTKVRWHSGGNGAPGIGPAEYFTYNAITTRGHPTAKTCNGTAAYSVFRPNLPEGFTSPGPATIYFDRDSNRLATPDVREQPKVAAADAANTTFFTSDSGGDLDTRPNFSGTSAAAPHAAAIAALVLQAHGGPGSVTPARMTDILIHSTFQHDLDPSSATGTGYTDDGSQGVVVTIDSDNESNTGTGQNDVNAIKVSYLGPGSLASLTFNPTGTAAQAGHVTGGNNGVQDDAGSSPATIKYFENNFPGLVFLPATKAFTLGTLTGLSAADVVAPTSSSPFTGFTNPAPAPSNGTSQFWTMTVGFPTGQFVDGKTVRFTVGRGVQHSASTGNGATIGAGTTSAQPIADLFGGGVMIPSGRVIPDGMAFTATTTDGHTITGRIKNNIGNGYSPVDGYGFINAEAAVRGGDLIFYDGFEVQ